MMWLERYDWTKNRRAEDQRSVLSSFAWYLWFQKTICVKWRCKADCVAAECTDPGSVAEVTRLSFFFKVSWKMKESETPDSTSLELRDIGYCAIKFEPSGSRIGMQTFIGVCMEHATERLWSTIRPAKFLRICVTFSEIMQNHTL